MLQVIGLMVGGYILFRMIDALCAVEKNTFVKVCAALVIVFTMFCMYAMIEGAPHSPTNIPGLVR